MNEVLEALGESVIIFAKGFNLSKTDMELAELAEIWFSAISDIPGLTPETIRRAHGALIRRATFWPKPAEVRQEVISARMALFSPTLALGSPEKKPITKAQRDAIHERMSEGGSRLLQSILAERNPNMTVETEIQFGAVE